MLTDIPDSWAWMAPDFLIRLLPFAAAAVVVELVWRPSWIGIGMGDLSSQLTFALVATPVAFAAGALGQRWLAFRRGGLSVPSGPGDAWFQAGFYAVNGPIEEAFFRGVIQGGLGALVTPPLGFALGTAAYVLYHRLGWSWPDTLVTAALGIPVGMAFWLLPGPPSLLGVSIVHVAATCGFLGPGPYLLRRLGWLR